MSPHTSTSHDPVQWSNPDDFDPSRYQHAPTSQDIDEARIRQMGLAKCPFDLTSFDVKDGRKAAMHNSGFGTVFAVADDRPLPVCDYAGFAPFGFGYRRCPGEQLTIMAFEDLIRKVAKGATRVRKGGRNRRSKGATRTKHSRDGAHWSDHRDQRRHRIHPPVLEQSATFAQFAPPRRSNVLAEPTTSCRWNREPERVSYELESLYDNG